MLPFVSRFLRRWKPISTIDSHDPWIIYFATARTNFPVCSGSLIILAGFMQLTHCFTSIL